MKIRHISKMHNPFGLLGAATVMKAGVIDQWIVPDKYSIMQMDYGLSIKNHAGPRVIEADIPQIVHECLPGVTDYTIEHDGKICRVKPKGGKNG